MKFQETDEGGQVGCRIRSDVTDIEFLGCRMSFDTTDDVNAGFDPAKRKKEKENARGVGSGVEERYWKYFNNLHNNHILHRRYN